MANARVDVSALYAALDAKRRSKELTWRALAEELGVSPSTMTRLSNGHRPDADGFVAMVAWLRQPADAFIDVGSSDLPTEQPDMIAELGALLRSRKGLSNSDARKLEDIFRAAYQAVRGPSG